MYVVKRMWSILVAIGDSLAFPIWRSQPSRLSDVGKHPPIFERKIFNKFWSFLPQILPDFLNKLYNLVYYYLFYPTVQFFLLKSPDLKEKSQNMKITIDWQHYTPCSSWIFISEKLSEQIVQYFELKRTEGELKKSRISAEHML